MTYTVNSFDICCQGNERLRSKSEFILASTVFEGVKPEDIQDDMKAQMQNQSQPDGFDWDAFNASLEAFISDQIEGHASLFDGIENPADHGDDEGVSLFVYMTGPGYADDE